jgi:hypothetical protein
MNELSRIEDMTEALTKIRLQTEKLKELQLLLSQWQIEFDVTVSMEPIAIEIRAIKPHGGKGLIKTISYDDILYYSQDVQGMVEVITQDIIDALLKPQIKEALASKVSKAVANSHLVARKIK